MSGSKFRLFGFGLVAASGAGLLTLTAMMNSAFAYGSGEDIGLVMGGSGLPIPGSAYVGAADQLYIDNLLHPIYPGTTYPDPYANGLFTPEGLYPLTGVHTLVLNYPSDPTTGFPALSTSVGQGMAILENAISSNTAAGDISTVFGYSQSSTISSLVMQQLDLSGTPSNIPAQFLLIGDPSAPNGGLLERFAGFETMSGQTHDLPLSLPALGVSFDGATPANDFTTSIYTLEYDGFADFPRYPLNFLADLNAFLGIEEIHGTYLTDFTPQDIASEAFLLPGSEALGADTLTNYYMIDQTPPLVQLLSGIPVIGKPLADLLGPDLTVLINLGYGADNLGYSTPANVPTPFGLFPNVNPTTLMNELVTGAQQGFSAFESDLSHLSLSSLLPATSSVAAVAPAALPSLTDIVNAISSAASTAYSTLLPTADIINALVTSVPAYDVSLFTDNLASGDLLDALGLPVAADTGLLTMAAGFEYLVISDAISQIAADFSGLFG
jgi:PE-PPE domain